ncbi:MAG: 4-hydroxythreonine-4-phosphate dehydrogenase PdxA [Microscillaceae bacterium]|jgi:4-hydroxythreonine-4-phosphate dehydrogenase|nr:4-hydroxythreonine-4-phosphate dehydrogenase PdxA [Microscillaceae bacterium]
MSDKKIPRDKPIIGITIGDFNGIGTEVILKALADNRILRICTPVIYGSMKIISKYRKLHQYPDWFINQVNNTTQITLKKTNLIAVHANRNFEVNPGQVTQEAGWYAVECLKLAVRDALKGQIDAVVTAPINKHNTQSEEFPFPGHTEYLANACGVEDNLMFLVSEFLRVGVLTGHVPLREVSDLITRERIFKKIGLMSDSLKRDFGVQKPKIAVLGFNPHAGEEGLLGNEEQAVIRPAVLELKKRGNLVYGPFPADGFFGKHDYRKFDAVLAMYHDQGLVPFKTLAMTEGVNFTAGLPIVRTSPDHGTAYDIAGKNLADETSLRESIFLACEIVKAREALKPELEEVKE